MNRITTKWYQKVPKTLHENIEFRLYLFRECDRHLRLRQSVIRWASEDPLFFINTLCFTYDPRLPPGHRNIPFITYDFQDEVILDLCRAISLGEDRGIEKSRDMGASWMCLTVYYWFWHFVQLSSFLMVSRIEDLVDRKNDPDCLFWKIDFILRGLPDWMVPAHERMKLSLTNLDNLSTITGASTTGETGRAGRKTSILLDEFASVPEGDNMLKATRDSTDCRIFNSTPKGAMNAFARLMNKTDIKKHTLHWTRHPVKARGLYYDKDHKARSPWYDVQCERAAHPAEIAQELDIDYQGSEFQFFDQFALDKVIAKTCTDPIMRGELLYDATSLQPLGFQSERNGRLRLWVSPDGAEMMPIDRPFVVGIDISSGTGASNSVASVGDCKEMRKVAELVTPNMTPYEFADYCVALARWFRGDGTTGALLIPEAMGPGRNFISRCWDMGYTNMYHRRNDMSIKKVVSDIPGWWPNKNTIQDLMGTYKRAIMTGEVVNPSRDALEECKLLVYQVDGSIVHSGDQAAREVDPSGARDQHGDRARADGLMVKGMLERGRIRTGKALEIDAQRVPGTIMYRRIIADRERRQKDYAGW